MFLDSSGRLFGKINIIDFTSLGVLALVAVGVIAVQSGWHKTSGQMVKGETDIEYTILLRNLKTLQPDLFVPGKKLAITIRNQPRGDVSIVDSKVSPKKLVVPMANGSFKLVDDPSDKYGYDYLVRLRDHALVSADGYVTEGIKVKIGLPIEVEGYNYRVTGIIADVQDVNAAKTP